MFERYVRRKLGYMVSIKVCTSIAKKKKTLTLLKAPFVHKTAQEQFVLFYFFKQLKLKFNLVIISYVLFSWVLSFVKKVIKSLSSAYKVNYGLSF